MERARLPGALGATAPLPRLRSLLRQHRAAALSRVPQTVLSDPAQCTRRGPVEVLTLTDRTARNSVHAILGMPSPP
ncbi:hypothetical protein GCM10023323_75590 [Streptomyces thinghirensis]|uniref:Uncharacterized protein n=1 Tax=Streptomyces thinghirensis TaxID=551547 RepID=A0ABP9TJG5_9ACTN